MTRVKALWDGDNLRGCRGPWRPLAGPESTAVYTDHVKYPNIADLTGTFAYARLQRGKDTIETAYPTKEIKSWAGRLRDWAVGKEPADLPRVGPAAGKPVPQEVFAYVIHEGKIRAPERWR